MKYFVLLLALFCVGCPSLPMQAYQLSVETNTAMMQKYEKVSYEFMCLMLEMVEQRKAADKPLGVLPDWIEELKQDDADVAKVAKVYMAMIQSGVMEETPWLTESLEVAESIIYIKEKYNE